MIRFLVLASIGLGPSVLGGAFERPSFTPMDIPSLEDEENRNQSWSNSVISRVVTFPVEIQQEDGTIEQGNIGFRCLKGGESFVGGTTMATGFGFGIIGATGLFFYCTNPEFANTPTWSLASLYLTARLIPWGYWYDQKRRQIFNALDGNVSVNSGVSFTGSQRSFLAALMIGKRSKWKAPGVQPKKLKIKLKPNNGAEISVIVDRATPLPRHSSAESTAPREEVIPYSKLFSDSTCAWMVRHVVDASVAFLLIKVGLPSH